MATSILHRITGVGLAAGSLALALWLYAAGYDPKLFREVSTFFAGTIGLILLVGWSAAFYYHLGNGIRHLFWDAGYGYTIPVMNKSGVFVFLFTGLMTGLTWAFVFGAFA